MNIEFSEYASVDIDNIIEYISNASFFSAQKFIIQLINYTYNLSIFPEMGTLVLKELNIRKLIYRKYIILYQINYNSNTINVIRIINSRQDINIISKHIIKYLK